MNLKIDPSQLTNVANQVGTKGDEFKRLLTKINGINDALKTDWEGVDATKYTTEVGKQAADMDQLAKAIKEISEFLNKAAKLYKDQAQANADGIKYGN